MGKLTASIAHEINQPLASIITNANTCLRMLPPIIRTSRVRAKPHGARFGTPTARPVIVRLRALFAKKDVATDLVDLNEATREVIALCSSDLQRNGAVLRLALAGDLPTVMGDRVQLPRDADKLFAILYTTKRDGMGIWLSVSRSIVESHRGRVCAAVKTARERRSRSPCLAGRADPTREETSSPH